MFKKFIFGYVAIIEFQICICTNLIKVVEIWQFNNLIISRPRATLNFRKLQFMACDLYCHAILLPCAKFH